MNGPRPAGRLAAAALLPLLLLLAVASPALAHRGPVPSTGAAAAVATTSATLTGSVVTNDRATSYAFFYGTTALTSATPTVEIARGADGPVSATVTGLTPGTLYHFRLVAFQTDRPRAILAGADATFTTLAVATTTATTTPTLAPVAPVPAATVPPPVLGQSVVLAPIAGRVLARAPGASAFTPLAAGASLPVGARVDTRAGTIRLTSALAGGATQSAEFHGAVFQVRQSARGNGMTDVHLRGPALACGSSSSGRGRAAAIQKRRKPPVRRLWAADNNGRFRTHGRNSVATVRGTRWTTTDTCRGTRTTVLKGVVSVRDLTRHRTVRVRAGQTYFAARRR